MKDLTASKIFYDKVMAVLGYNIVLDIEGVVIGYGTTVHDMFEIRHECNDAPLSSDVHIAFNAKDRETVEAFYSTALKQGARCNGKPGYRPEYEDGYYAAFVLDLDGHNIEAVYAEQS